MKCTSKSLGLLLAFSLVLSLSGCSPKESVGTYDIFDSSFEYGITNAGETASSAEFYARNICVAAMEDIGTANVHSSVCQGAGAFNLSTNEVIYAQNVHEQLYPASTTKILTCLVALENGNLNDYYTVSANAVKQDKDSSTIKLKEGDIITLRDLLYGLMLRSGNDAAIAIAEGVAGDVESFVQLMNEKAASIGATNTHFVNTNGLHNEDHYTTVYDMYLILNEAVKNQDFNTIFSAKNYTASYTSKGEGKTQDWASTNQYLNGSTVSPSGITVIGGKTGTTGAAGYCLVLLSENEKNEKIVSIVFNADGRSNLYLIMNEILQEYAI